MISCFRAERDVEEQPHLSMYAQMAKSGLILGPSVGSDVLPGH